MNDMLRLTLDIGCFFIGCTIIFLVGFVVDAWAQARRAAAETTGRARSVGGLSTRSEGHEAGGLEAAQVSPT